MDAKLTIDGREVGFRATALTPRLYRYKMGRDIIRDLNQLKAAYSNALRAQTASKPGEDATEEERAAYEQACQEAQLSVMDLQIFEDVAYIMAKQYDASIPATSEEWLDGFPMFSIYEVLPIILSLWSLGQETTSLPKKK